MIVNSGCSITLKRATKQEADEYILSSAPPIPPTKKVIVFGNLTEEAPNTKDPEYQKAYQRYLVTQKRKKYEFLSKFIVIESGLSSNDLEDFHEIGLDNVAILRDVVLTEEEANSLMEDIFYHATVTNKGIEEAQVKFGLMWNGQPLSKWNVPSMPMRQSREYEDRRAAKFNLITYEEFCKLSGPEQSRLVEFMRAEGVIGWLSSQQKKG